MRIAPRSSRFAIFSCRALSASAAEAASADRSNGHPSSREAQPGSVPLESKSSWQPPTRKGFLTVAVFYQSSHRVGTVPSSSMNSRFAPQGVTDPLHQPGNKIGPPDQKWDHPRILVGTERKTPPLVRLTIMTKAGPTSDRAKPSRGIGWGHPLTGTKEMWMAPGPPQVRLRLGRAAKLGRQDCSAVGA